MRYMRRSMRMIGVIAGLRTPIYAEEHGQVVQVDMQAEGDHVPSIVHPSVEIPTAPPRLGNETYGSNALPVGTDHRYGIAIPCSSSQSSVIEPSLHAPSRSTLDERN